MPIDVSEVKWNSTGGEIKFIAILGNGVLLELVNKRWIDENGDRYLVSFADGVVTISKEESK